MISRVVVKVVKVRSKWFSGHFDQLQASSHACFGGVVKVVKVILSRT